MEEPEPDRRPDPSLLFRRDRVRHAGRLIEDEVLAAAERRCGTVDALHEAAAVIGSRCGTEVLEASMLESPAVELTVRD